METNARGGVDAISRTHRMTIDEATQILNIKKGAFVEDSELQQMLKVRVPSASGFFFGVRVGVRDEGRSSGFGGIHAGVKDRSMQMLKGSWGGLEEGKLTLRLFERRRTSTTSSPRTTH